MKKQKERERGGGEGAGEGEKVEGKFSLIYNKKVLFSPQRLLIMQCKIFY